MGRKRSPRARNRTKGRVSAFGQKRTFAPFTGCLYRAPSPGIALVDSRPRTTAGARGAREPRQPACNLHQPCRLRGAASQWSMGDAPWKPPSATERSAGPRRRFRARNRPQGTRRATGSSMPPSIQRDAPPADTAAKRCKQVAPSGKTISQRTRSFSRSIPSKPPGIVPCRFLRSPGATVRLLASNVRFGWRFQPVNATACRYRSIGVS